VAGDRQRFLRGLGLSEKDVARIKALAEARVRDGTIPAALVDLDAPIRVGAYSEDEAYRFSGERLGTWAGRILLYWPRRE
jgi:hypothetical protein